MLTDDVVNAMLDYKFPTGTGTDRCYLSVHSAYSATGANLIGAKVAGAWAAATSCAKGITAAIDISVAAGNTVKYVGFWGKTTSAGDTFLGMNPNLSDGDLFFQVDTANDRIMCENHGFANDDKVVFYGGTPPIGLSEGVTYYVVGVTAGDPDYFQVSDTQGGSPKNITGQSSVKCAVSNIVEEVYPADGTHRISSLTVNL